MKYQGGQARQAIYDALKATREGETPWVRFGEDWVQLRKVSAEEWVDREVLVRSDQRGGIRRGSIIETSGPRSGTVVVGVDRVKVGSLYTEQKWFASRDILAVITATSRTERP